MRTVTMTLASVVLAASLTAPSAHSADEDVTIGAASVGGTYYVWASGLANALGQAGFNANVEVTGGPLHNIQLVDAGQMQLGLSTAAPAYEGLHGEEWAEGESYDKIRALIPMYPSYFTWWSLAGSGIDEYKDIAGHSVAMGPVGGTPDTYGRKLYKFSGVSPSRIVNAGFSDIVNMLRDGQVEAAFTTAGLPHPAVAETESTNKINLITVPHEVSQSFIDKYPYFQTGIVPAGTYDAVTEDQETLTVWNFVIASEAMSEETAYNIVKAAFDNRQTILEAHRSAETMTVDNLDKITIPLHPGAVRYYKEQGVEIPERLLP